jgi:hypothetical protein
MSKGASGPPQDVQDVAVGLEYARLGGWLRAVSNLIRWLRAAGCFEYVHCLDREVQSLSPTSGPEAEEAALKLVHSCLAHVYNDPPSHLTPDQRKELRALHRRAARFVQYRLRQLANDQECTERAVRNLEPRLAASGAAGISILAQAQQAAAETSQPDPPAGADRQQVAPPAEQADGEARAPAPGATAATGHEPRRRAKRGTVNQRMLEQLQREPDSCYWTQRKWADFLGCKAASSVAKAPAWQTVKAARAMAAVDRFDRKQNRQRK